MQKLFICSPTGNESFPCGRSKDNPCNLATIIPQIQNGTILSLLSGNYSLPLSFSLTGTHLSIIGDVEGGTNIITTPFIQLYSSFLYAEHLNFIGFEVYSTSLEDKSDAFIQIDSNSRFSLYHSSFQNITLSSASMILSEGELELIDCTFQNNRIQDNSGERIVGSILLHYSSSPLTISQSLFDNNWISGEGECFGLIFVNGSRYTIDQSVVSNNYINCGYSIGVFILSSDENDIENSVKILSNSLFTNNTVTASTNQFSIQNAYGGGLWIRDLPSAFLSNSSLQLLNNTLVNNTAMYGGGVFLQVIGKDNNEEDWLNCDSLFDIMQYNKPANCSSNEKGMRFYQQPPSEIWPSFTFYSSLVFYDWFNVTIANPPSSISVSNPFGGNLLHSLTGLTRFPNYQYSNSDSSDSYIVNSNEIIEFYISISGLMNSGATLLFKSSQFIQSIEGEFILSTNITLSSSCAPNFEIVSSSCTLCEDDKYNFDGGNSCSFCSNSDLTPCLKYPSQGDQTIVFDVINIEAGYWPDQFTSPSTLIPCPMTNSCKPISCIIYSNQSPPFVDCSYCSNSSTTIATLADSLPLSLNNSLPNSTSNQTINYDCRCEDGYTNRLCSECICESISNCYYTSSNQCVQCTFLQSLSWWMIVILIVVGIIVTIIVIIIPKTTSFWMIGALLVCLIAGFTSFYSWSFLTLIFLLIALFMIADKGLPPGAVNSILYFLQTTTSLIDLHSWPQVMYPIIESFQISNLNFSFASCFWPKVLSNVLTQFISFYSILLPVLFFSILTAVTLEIVIGNYQFIISLRSRFDRFLLSIYCTFRKVIQKIPINLFNIDNVNNYNYNYNILVESENEGEERVQNQSSFEVRDDHSDIERSEDNLLINDLIIKNDTQKQEKYKKISTRSSAISISLLTAGYFPVTLMSLHVIPTSNGYMFAYPWIPVWSSSYITFLSISLIVLIIYTIGLPIAFTSLLYIFRKAIARGSKTTTQRFGSLYSNYRKEIYYYHIIYLLKKAIIACLVSLFTNQTDTQTEEFLTLLALGIFATLQLIIQPFHSRMLNWISGISEMVILISYSINILLTSSGSNEEWLKWIMTLLNSFVLLLFFLYLFIVKLKQFRRLNNNQIVPLLEDSEDL